MEEISLPSMAHDAVCGAHECLEMQIGSTQKAVMIRPPAWMLVHTHRDNHHVPQKSHLASPSLICSSC